MTKSNSQHSHLGQPIIMGVPGTTLTDGLKQLIETVQPGGLILFARNLETPEQIFNLIREFSNLCQEPPIITIDQEGGRVSRLAQVGATPPSGQELMKADQLNLCLRHGELTGKLLHLFGFNLNLAPVVDFSLDETADNSLRGRCFGSSPEEVIKKAGAFLEGMQSEGILGTAKHFPGYTFCELDPHGELPKIERSQEEIKEVELKSFRYFIDKAEAFMIGHGHFTAWHQESFPASLSSKLVNELLRKEMGYKGLIMTDDIEMGAIANRYGSAETTKMAMECGQDAMLICHNPACVQLAYDQLCELPPETTASALENIKRFKEKMKPAPKSFDAEAFENVNKQIELLRQKTLS